MVRLLLIVILILSTLCTSNPPVQSPSSDERVNIYIVGHYGFKEINYHAGIILPKVALEDSLDILPLYFRDKQYFEFGWGDSGFYQTEEVTFELAATALFWPTDSVMHVVAFNPEPEQFFPYSRLTSIEVTMTQLKLMAAKIAESFVRDENQVYRYIGPGRYGESRFFEAVGIYHGLYTCNSWTADVLKAGGLPVNQWFNLTAGSIFLQANRLN